MLRVPNFFRAVSVQRGEAVVSQVGDVGSDRHDETDQAVYNDHRRAEDNSPANKQIFGLFLESLQVSAGLDSTFESVDSKIDRVSVHDEHVDDKHKRHSKDGCGQNPAHSQNVDNDQGKDVHALSTPVLLEGVEHSAAGGFRAEVRGYQHQAAHHEHSRGDAYDGVLHEPQ